MDAYRIEPFGGDVEDEEYRAPIPNLIFPLVFVVGHVVGIEKENKIQHVHMRCGKYVRDTMVYSSIE
ncbi:hypothetical protein H0H92_011036 [Tricholoma furcatifolium]|nr:hypothetical protein H0H92_011036 [Tricholoma furcatifolium]